MKTSGIGGSAGGDVAAALLAVASRAAQLALKVSWTGVEGREKI